MVLEANAKILKIVLLLTTTTVKHFWICDFFFLLILIQIELVCIAVNRNIGSKIR